MKHILLAATALVLCGGPVFAQTSTSGATVTTGSQSQSGSVATSNPSITGMSVGNGTSASNSGATANTRSLSGSTASASPTQTTAITINTGSNSGNTGGGRGSRAGSNVSGSGTVAGAASGSAAGSSTRAARRAARAAAANGSGGSGATPIASGSGSTPASTGTSGVGATAADSAIPTTGIQYSGGTNSTQTINGTQTIKNTPEVIAPGIVGGNPCSVGVSGGIGLPGFGITGGGTWADKGCERRQVAALLWNIEQHTAALEVLCKDGDVRDAMKIAGTPCAMDRPVAVASVPAPAPAVVTTVLPPVAAPQQTLRKLPDWCSNVSKQEWKARSDIRAACG